jgi:RNA polymerase sigma factor (sigma-70 family)
MRRGVEDSATMGRVVVIANHDVDRARSRLEDTYRAHAREVLAYARRRVPPEDAYEVVAETFLTAWRRLDVVPERALPWLLGVARKVVANQRRSANRRLALVGKIGRLGRSADRDPHPSAPSDVGELVLRAMGSLPERQREALMLCFWDDLDPATAAQVAGCSPRVLSARLYRGRRRLARKLGTLDRSAIRGDRSGRPFHQEAREE